MLGFVAGLFRKLVGLNGKVARPHVGTDRRQHQRCCASGHTACQIVSGVNHAHLVGLLTNISPGGICLRVDRPVERGTLLHVSPVNPSSRRWERLLACVIHAHPLPDQTWSLGCSFIRDLSVDDMRAFV